MHSYSPAAFLELFAWPFSLSSPSSSISTSLSEISTTSRPGWHQHEVRPESTDKESWEPLTTGPGLYGSSVLDATLSTSKKTTCICRAAHTEQRSSGALAERHGQTLSTKHQNGLQCCWVRTNTGRFNRALAAGNWSVEARQTRIAVSFGSPSHD
jgi:hypothetical protein